MRGIIAMPSLTNVVRAASDLTQSNWTKRGSISVTAAYDQAMGGQYTQVRNLENAGTDDVFGGSASGLTPGARYEPCFFLRPISTTGVISFANGNGDNDGLWSVDLSKVGTNYLINRSHPAITIHSEFKVAPDGLLFVHMFSAWGEGNAFDIDISCITLVAGTAPAATPIPNTSTSAAATRNADSLVVNVPDGSYSISTTYGDGSTEAVSDTASSGLTLTSADFSKATVKKMQGNPA